MNKTIFLIIGIVVLSNIAVGQSEFGLKTGINLANQVKTIAIPQIPSITQHTRPFLGYQLGAFYKTTLYHHFSLSAEANLSVIGSAMTLVTPDLMSYHTNEKLGYIELPLTLQYTIHKFYFGLGPGVGFKVFSKLTHLENRTYGIPYYRTLDAAGNFIAGYSVSNRIDVNVRYSRGFVNICKDPGYAFTKNRFFNLSFLYSLK